MGSGLHLYVLSMVRACMAAIWGFRGCFPSIGDVMAKIKDIIWSIVMTVSAIRKYGVHEAQSWRDGDLYDPDTNFWYVCPYCLEPLDENEQATQADPDKAGAA